MEKIGITERTDPVFEDSWKNWVRQRKPAIIITKNFKRLYEENPGLMAQRVLIHATITGYGGSTIEPGVPHPLEIIKFLESLPENEKKLITVRIDPIIPTEDCVNISLGVFKRLRDKGFREFRISILDLYKHVFERMHKIRELPRDFIQELRNIYRPLEGDFKWIPHAPYPLRKKIIQLFPGAKTCCEPGMDETNVACVSREDVLLLKIDTEDKRLLKKKQREFCGCVGLKHELLHGTEKCQHKCVYCYWQDR